MACVRQAARLTLTSQAWPLATAKGARKERIRDYNLKASVRTPYGLMNPLRIPFHVRRFLSKESFPLKGASPHKDPLRPFGLL